MRDFIDRHSLTFPSLRDEAGDVFARFGVPFQPAWVFIGTDGSITKVQGSLDAESLAPFIDDLTSGV